MWNFNKILDICGLQILKTKLNNENISFYLNQRRVTAHCPKCKNRTNIIHGFSPLRKIKHGTILGKTCLLVIRPRRFRCIDCDFVFTEEILVRPYERATLKHKREVIFNLSDRSFSSGTKRYAVSYHTQRKWLKELVHDEVLNFEKERVESKPFVLGIDEVSFAGRNMVTTIGNITKHRLKGVLHSRRKDESKQALRSLPSDIKPLISEVVIDMCDLYLRSVKEVLPKVSVVVDHFHIIQDANRRIDE